MSSIPRGRTFRVLDRAALAEIADWIIENKGGPWSSVTGPLRNLQPTLSRLKNRQLDKISAGAVSELTAFLKARGEGERVTHLTNAVMSTDAQWTVFVYALWLVNANNRYWTSMRESPRYTMTATGPAVIGADKETLEDVRQQWTASRLIARKRILARILSDNECRRIVNGFDKWARERHHEGSRIEISINRMIDPLVESADTGFVERSIDELSASELRRFVRASMVRERILLSRSAVVDRIQSSAACSGGGEPRNINDRTHGPKALSILVGAKDAIMREVAGLG